jgi:hypothetical protein
MRVERMRSISQISGSFTAHGEAGSPPYAALMSQPEWSFERKGDILIVRGEFGFIGRRGKPEEIEDPKEQMFIDIDSTFVVEYVLAEGDEITDDDVMAFARLNANLNVHPYWREYIYNTLSRANMPTLLIPPFNPVKLGITRGAAKTTETPAGKSKDKS